ncbi:hypothetical protein BJ875DRAFT_385419 [Amylocarpus encephaloides]|uniref:RRM domain-containing protein n=1 Tax=Amylocarpus encephaloides TaxID=45428 RepID=A0A9P7YAW6_9HELO|nr:hypothetical protein BJ875DRAFT_385419 [Amylocarpus encephaloides]
MTETHTLSDPSQLPVVAFADSLVDQKVNSPSSDWSFSDAYKSQPTEGQEIKDVKADQGTEVSDDYAMTFESDGEEGVGAGTDSQDVSKAILEQPTHSLPTTVPANDLTPSIPTNSSINELLQAAQLADPTQANPPFHPAPIDAPTIQPNSPTVQAPVQSNSTAPSNFEDIANGGIDIQQLLDNITANAEKNDAAAAAQSPSSQITNSSLPRASAGLPVHSSLPPRPQIPPNHSFNDDIQKYHAGPPGVPPQSANAFRPPGGAPPNMGGGPPSALNSVGGLPPPPTTSFRQTPISNPSPITPSYPQGLGPNGQVKVDPNDDFDGEDARWGPDVQAQYDDFLVAERMYVTEGLWDRFPVGSRLFIGNLPSEKVTKRDLFHVFHKYGRLAQVSIKQAYGFIQFHEAAACYRALDHEQGAEVRGRKMHLEISKPQKNSRNAQANAPPLRKSRSPVRENQNHRGGRRGQGRNNNGGDTYDGRSGGRDEYGRQPRSRDEYWPVRSPSPPRASFRGRDDYGPRGRDPYDGRDRRRSRSRSPYNNRDNMRYRERSPSPRRDSDLDLQIPHREPHNVPDIQIILMDQLDRGFVGWVEGEFRGRGNKTEVMFLSPRLPLEAVIQRQILEGVHAVSQLTMRSQNSSKIPLQVFDRQGGANNVRFDEYQDLEPRIAAELVVRAKQTPLPPQQPPVAQYAQPPYPPVQQYQQPPAPVQTAPNLANIIGNLGDNSALQNLLGSMNNAQQQNAPAVASNSAIDLASLLGGLQKQQPAQQHQHGYAPQPAAADPYASLAANPASSLANYLGNQQAQQGQPQQSAQQVQNIMASLAKFRQGS